jgi:hypothetical protein
VAQLVEHHLAKVRVAGSNPVVRSERVSPSPCGERFPGGVAERRGNGLQIRVHGFKSRLHLGRLAQWERASLTRKRSLVQIQYRPPASPLVKPCFCARLALGWLTCRRRTVGLSIDSVTGMRPRSR